MKNDVVRSNRRRYGVCVCVCWWFSLSKVIFGAILYFSIMAVYLVSAAFLTGVDFYVSAALFSYVTYSVYVTVFCE